MATALHGVYCRLRDRHYEPTVKYRGKLIYLKSWHNPTMAARVRDVAAKWLYGPNATLNFPDVSAPAPVRESDIAGWLIERGVPVSFLVHRVPRETLLAAGVNESDLDSLNS